MQRDDVARDRVAGRVVAVEHVVRVRLLGGVHRVAAGRVRGGRAVACGRESQEED